MGECQLNIGKTYPPKKKLPFYSGTTQMRLREPRVRIVFEDRGIIRILLVTQLEELTEISRAKS